MTVRTKRIGLGSASAIVITTCVIGLPPAEASAPVVMCDGEVATIVGTDGGDRIIGTEGPDVIVGAGGNDSIDGGQGDDVICGGRGAERILGGEGNDRLFGEQDGRWSWGGPRGDLLESGPGDDYLDPGADGRHVVTDNTVTFAGETSGVVVNAKRHIASGSRSGNDEIWNAYTVIGTSHDDRVIGVPIVYASTGDDVVRAVPGHHGVIYGDVGNDRLSGTHLIYGGAGDDVVRAAPGGAVLYGEDGNDRLIGGRGYDDGYGWFGDDTCLHIEYASSCE